jgi:signal transduction histidine kinase
MRAFCRDFSAQQKSEIDFTSHDLLTQVPMEVSVSLFRVLQESLHNAARHSGGRRFEVELFGAPDAIHLTVRDSGGGFDTKSAIQSQGLGLTSMRERLKLVNGTLSIDSQIQVGTKVQACVPLLSMGT